VIYINPTNGSDQLAKNYNYNLGTLLNPYEPRRIVAFQNINEALAARDPDNGDLVLIKTGSTWTNYDVWSQNKTAEFNTKKSQVSSYSQRQCRGEDLTWVPSSVNDTQSADTAPVTEFTNNNDITVANTELVTPSNPIINQAPTNAPQNTTSTSSSRKSSGGSSSGGSSADSNSLNTGLDNLTDPQQTTNSTRASRNQLQNSLAETALKDDVLAGLDPTIIEETVNDSDVPSIDNGQDEIDTVYTPECNASAPWENAIQTYPQDSDGWSIIKPDIETKIVYVSSSEGDDSSGQAYNGVGMDDPFNPSSVKAYKTIEAAYAQIRDDKPDWILLKKGDKFELEKTIWLKSGKTHNAHIVFGAFGGENDKRPIIQTSNNAAFQGVNNQSFITLVGLEIYASGLDPTSKKFLGWDAKRASGFINVAGTGNYGNHVQGIHLENNRISYYENGVVFGATDKAENRNIVIRRNEILNSYSVNAHSQGVFLNNLNGGLIEENIFDHNGWYQQRPLNVPLNTKSYGYATYFNHNAYIVNSSNLIIKNNLSSRSSSMGFKFASNSNNETKHDAVNSANILVENNLVVEGELGFSIGGNTDFNNDYRWDNIQVVGNVLSNMGKSQPTNRNIAWNIEVSDWQTGSICGNYMIDQGNPQLTNLAGIIIKGHIGALDIYGNTIINQAQKVETYSNDLSTDLTSSNNAYIFKNTTNKLETYLNKNNYTNFDDYINDVLKRLQVNPNNTYEIDEVLDYLKNVSLLERTKMIIQ
jgi:hypothetical protein